MRSLHLLLFGLGLLAGCGKPPKPYVVTTADLEPTNAPAAPGLTLYAPRPGSKIRIEGTANMIHTHWQVESPAVGGRLQIGQNFPTEPGQAVQPGKVEAQAEVFIPVRSLKSVEPDGRPYSEKMDEVMYEHLKALNQPQAQILYRLKELNLKAPARDKDSDYLFECKGELVVAGVTNTITMPVHVLPLGDKRLKVFGNTSVKMTDFKVQPPAPLGMMLKTGDEVKLFFEWVLAAKPATNAPAVK